ncbi:MAG: hypothetical protein WCK08_03815, partial [Betaproteobacteria bacterium]
MAQDDASASAADAGPPAATLSGAFEAASPYLLAQAPSAAQASDAAAGSASASTTGAVGATSNAAVEVAATTWIWMVPFALAGAALVSRSSSSAASNTSGDVTRAIRVVDGPVKNATVYVDLNDDGVINAGEPSVGTTGSDGSLNVTLTAEQAAHGLLAKGGIDTETNKSFAGVLAAPKGSTVINPLTTLVAALIEGGSGLSLAAAKQAVVDKLGLTAGVDVTTYDTFKLAAEGNANALADHKKAVQIANIIVAGSALVAGGGDQVAAASSVVDALAGAIKEAVRALAPSVTFDNATVSQVLTTAGATVNASEVAKSIVAVNTVVANASGANATLVLAATAQAQVLAQSTLSNAIATASSGGLDTIKALQDSQSASQMASKIDAKSTDVQAPAAPTLALGTGVSNGATSAEAAAAGGVVSVVAEAGASTVVTFSRSGGGTVSKTVTGNGSTAVPVTLSAADLTTLGDGTISVSAVATDAAGNASSAGTGSFTLDTAAPAAPTLALGTGVSNGATSAEATAAG